jgi:integrase
MPPLLSPLSTATHSEVESLLRLGVAPRPAINAVCCRPITVQDAQAFALAPTTRATFSKIATEVTTLAAQHKLPPWSRDCLQRYFQSFLDKGWKLSSVLSRVRMTAMLTSRYTNYDLNSEPWFKDLTQGLQRLASLDAPKQASPLTFPHLQELLSSLIRQHNWQMAAFLSLTWLTAGRLGEILGLPRQNLRIHDEPMSVKLSISKGVFGAQEKILHPGPLTEILKKWFHDAHQAQTCSRLFSLTRQQVVNTLRSFDPLLSGHSLRRGALQHADRKGVDSTDLQTLSGHKSTSVLQRYLGRAASSRRQAMTRTGRALQQL